MESFRRIFKYVWPQWDRLIVAFLSAIIIGILFAVSVGTVLPLLKVMMGEEGLHGWVDRKIITDRYGINFYVPNKIDLSDPEKIDVVHHLRITGLEDDSPAYESGLLENDLIVGVGDPVVQDENDGKMLSTELLEQFATAEDDSLLIIQYRRLNASGSLESDSLKLPACKRPFYTDMLQKLVGFVPRQQSRENSRKSVVFIILLLVVVTVMRCTAKFCQVYTVQKVTQTAVARLREDMFGHVMELPVVFFGKKGASDTVSRLTRDTTAAASGVKILFGKALREPLKAFFLLIVAIAIDYKLTIVFAASAPVALYTIGKFGKKMKRATRKSLRSWSDLLRKVRETISAVNVVKVYNSQNYEQGRFRNINSRLLKQQFKIAKVDSLTGPILEMLGMMAGSAGLLVAVNWVYENKMDPSEFFTLLIALGVAAESLRKTSNIWNKIQMADAAAERVYSVIDYRPEAKGAAGSELPRLSKKIEFKNITFGYPETGKAVLKDLSLCVNTGDNIAIVGPNGSGKTTLANLLPRLYEPDSGQILIDGRDIKDATLHSLRAQIAMVTQNVITFNDTIAANIAYGRPDAARADIIAAAKRAFAHEFVKLLPDGYDSVIGEQGSGLSGGQLQRIVIARAILKDPAILIFDEATSQIDADSESKIHTAIEEIMHTRTTFLIAHRFSTVISADLIVVMNDGRIIARGRHEQLMQSCSLYQNLYKTQLVKA